MKTTNTVGKSIIKNIFLLILLLSMIFVWKYYSGKETLEVISAYTGENAVQCNLNSGFYDRQIDIELNKDTALPKGAEILYTLNGDDPRTSGEKYRDPISVLAEEDEKVVVLRAVAYYNGEYSEVINRSFFVGKNIKSRYNVPVISLITDNDNLFDYEKGIFVPGAAYQKYLDEGGDPEADKSLVPGNYNQRGDEWIREAYLGAFDSDGTVEAEQGIGLGTQGGASRGYPIKSLKLIANEIYDSTKDKFSGEFWRDYADVEEYHHNRVFNKILLKSGGQDYAETQVRWDLASRLANEAGLYPVAGSKKVVVYLNGEYYGLMSMTEDYSAFNIGQETGVNKEFVEVQKGPVIYHFSDIEELFMADLSEKENREKLEAMVDIDQFMLYYALQTVLNNVDWPWNNYGTWRYIGEPVEGNEYADGRYRFLLFDMDLIYMSDEDYKTEIFGSEILDELLRGDRDERFENIISSQYYRNKFINMISDLCNTVLKTEHILQVCKEITDEMKLEIYKWKENQYNQGEKWISTFLASWEMRLQSLEAEIECRNTELLSQMESYWDLSKKYKLIVHGNRYGEILCNTIRVEMSDDVIYEGNYYKEAKLEISAKPQAGYQLAYWLVNGTEVYEESLILDEKIVTTDETEIFAMFERTEGIDGLVINEVSAKGSFNDWIEIYNGSAENIKLEEFSLSDEKGNLQKYSCPSVYLPAGETIVINGKANMQMGAYICNFNLKAGEVVYLTNKITGEIIDSLTIPEMSEGESYGRYRQGQRFVFFSIPTYGELNG
ncbi:MAG: CotH kinase family protein [Eubacteriales bacterium]|nr:CotH kinase family protein [Eubacteriales bacterium]